MAQQAREKVFFSHSKPEEPFARALAHRLQWSGFDPFLDLWDVPAAEPVPAEIATYLTQSSTFFFVVAPSPVQPKWFLGAHYALLYQRMKNVGLRIIPLLRGNAPTPQLLAPLRHFDFRNFNLNDPTAFRTDKEGPYKELMEGLGRKYEKTGGSPIPPGFAVYEFAFQPRKSKPKNFDGTLNYELVLQNVKKDPIKNFVVTVRFRAPVVEVQYDKYRSSSGMLSGGEGLSADRTRFNWIGETFYGGGGFIIFHVRSKGVPEIARFSTKFVGRVAGTNKVIPPDPEGL